ncbi:PocR ligand-binding domain-containing protein [Clostridium neuense]|uniref:histidine kinase n=1 Tax=Clostridium neuense TaxID=1728934 RepID=A0ABW8TC09_9CLOT
MENIEQDIDVDSIEIKDIIDISLLQKFQDNFAESMNMACVTVDRNGVPVTKPTAYTKFCEYFIHSTNKGDKECANAHKYGGERATEMGKPCIYKCHAGLIDFAAPILIDGKQIGTILGGQILEHKFEKSDLEEKARKLGIDGNGFFKAAEEVKIIDNKSVKAAVDLLFMFANFLSKIGYEELQLRQMSKRLKNEILQRDTLLKEANEYNALKTRLFSTISHELKTPINIIYSAIQLLENMYTSDEKSNKMDLFLKYSGVMKQNCYRLIRLINNYIDINKIGLGFYKLEEKNGNIVNTIEDITMSVVEYAKLKDIKVIFDTDVEEKIMAYDSEKIERIMLNLLSNAIKFTDMGGNIKVSIHDNEKFVIISVKDNGSGIPEDMLEKIFDVFIQVDDSIRRNVEGSGIGLSLVKSFVEMHGGNITVESKLQGGSEFLINLPVKIIDEDPNINKDKGKLMDMDNKEVKIELSDIYL